MTYYLAIDQGTHASRAMVYAANGDLVSSQVKSVILNHTSSGYIEQDPLEILDSVATVIDDLLGSLPQGMVNQIAACGFACQRSTVVACNHDGKPLSPALSWQDVRGKPFVDSLTLSSKRIQQLSGLPLTPHYSASKCRWLLEGFELEHSELEHHENVPIDSLKLAPLSSFLLFHLVGSGQFVVDHTQAQRMQLMDIQTLDWSKELMQAFQISPSALPSCKPVMDNYGFLRDTQIPVTAVCGDQNAALFGSEHLTKDEALINLGSGAFVLRMLPKQYKHQDHSGSTPLLTSIACSSGSEVSYFLEGTVNGSGNALDWFQQQFLKNNGLSWKNRKDWKSKLPSWLKAIANPPIFINTVGGLGSPWWLSRSSGSLEPRFINNDGRVKNLDEQLIEAYFVAVIESIVFLVQNNLDIMNKDQSLSLLKISGGLSQQDGICQMFANLSQLPVQRLVNKETTARGVAWLASRRKKSWGELESSANNIFQPMNDTQLSYRYRIFCDYLKDLS